MRLKTIKTIILLSNLILTIACLLSCRNCYNNELLITDFQEKTKDSIIYELPIKTLNYVRDSLLNQQKISFITIVSNDSENEYYYSFHLTTDKISEEGKLVSTTRFLRYFNNNIPILFNSDYIFNPELRSSIKETKDFNWIILKVNANGDILDGFSY